MNKNNIVESVQRSPEWFAARKGRFTASTISQLLGKLTHKKTVDAIDGYALEAAIDTVHGLEPEPEYLPADMQRGVELEPLAFELFSELMAQKFTPVTPTFFAKYGAHSGASCDGLVGKDATVEIKCPKRKKFFQLVTKGIEAVDQTYYDQIQMQLLATGRKKCYFFNYCVDRGQEYYHTIEIPRDEERITLIKERIRLAAARKKELIKSIESNSQF